MADDVGLDGATSGVAEGIAGDDVWGGDDYRGEGVRPRRFTLASKAAGSAKPKAADVPAGQPDGEGNGRKEARGLDKAAASFIIANHRTMTNLQIAEHLGVCRSTFYRWREKLRARNRLVGPSVSDEVVEEWKRSWERHVQRQRIMGISEEDMGEWGELDVKMATSRL